MLGEAFKVLKKEASEAPAKTKKLARTSYVSASKFLPQESLLNLQKQSQKEAKLPKSSQVTSLGKTGQM